MRIRTLDDACDRTLHRTIYIRNDQISDAAVAIRRCGGIRVRSAAKKGGVSIMHFAVQTQAEPVHRIARHQDGTTRMRRRGARLGAVS